MSRDDEKLHIFQLLSVFIWGLLLGLGLSGSGYLEQFANRLTTDAQQLFHLATYVVAIILAVISILIFLYPIYKGVHAYRLAGPLGLIGLVVAFASGYYFPLRLETSIILAALAIVLWIVGRSFVRRGQKGP